jgi:hypothetical protein
MATLRSLKVPEPREFYDRLRKRGLASQQALVAIMRKTVHIAFGILKHRKPYRADWHQHQLALAARAQAESHAMSSVAVAESAETNPPELTPVVNGVMIRTMNGVPKLVVRARQWPGRVKKTPSDLASASLTPPAPCNSSIESAMDSDNEA